MTRWTADTWCACPTCNGPSLPQPVPDIGERLPSLPAGHAQCHACGHVWRPDKAQWSRALAMWTEADTDRNNDLWAETVGMWRVRMKVERERLERAMRGEW